MVLKRAIKKKTVYLNVANRRYRYIELLEEILPDFVDLTTEGSDEEGNSIDENNSESSSDDENDQKEEEPSSTQSDESKI